VTGQRSGHIVSEAALYAIAGAFGKIAALITVPYLTRELSPDGYGLVDLAISTAAILQLFAAFSADIPTIRMAAGATDKDARRAVLGSYVLTTMLGSTILTLLLIPLSPLAAETLWSAPGQGILAATAFLLVPVSSGQAALVTVQRIERRPGVFAILAAIDLVAQLGLAVLFVAIGMGPFGVLLGFILGSALGFTAALAATRRYLSLTLGRAIPLIRGGLPFLPSVLAFTFADGAARFITANLLGVAEVGVLAVAIRLASVMALASAAFSLAWGPYGLALRPSPSGGRVHGDVLVWFGSLMAAGTVALGSFAPEVALLVAGEDFAAASLVMPILLLGAGLAGPSYVFTTGAGILERGASVAAAAVVGAAVQIVGSFLLLPVMGLQGYGYAALAGRMVTLVLLAIFVRRLIRLSVGTWVAFGLVLILVAAIQFLNAQPDATFWLRAVLSVASVMVAIWLVVRAPSVDRPLYSHASESRTRT